MAGLQGGVCVGSVRGEAALLMGLRRLRQALGGPVYRALPWCDFTTNASVTLYICKHVYTQYLYGTRITGRAYPLIFGKVRDWSVFSLKPYDRLGHIAISLGW